MVRPANKNNKSVLIKQKRNYLPVSKAKGLGQRLIADCKNIILQDHSTTKQKNCGKTLPAISNYKPTFKMLIHRLRSAGSLAATLP